MRTVLQHYATSLVQRPHSVLLSNASSAACNIFLLYRDSSCRRDRSLFYNSFFPLYVEVLVFLVTAIFLEESKKV